MRGTACDVVISGLLSASASGDSGAASPIASRTASNVQSEEARSSLREPPSCSQRSSPRPRAESAMPISALASRGICSYQQTSQIGPGDEIVMRARRYCVPRINEPRLPRRSRSHRECAAERHRQRSDHGERFRRQQCAHGLLMLALEPGRVPYVPVQYGVGSAISGARSAQSGGDAGISVATATPSAVRSRGERQPNRERRSGPATHAGRTHRAAQRDL